MIAGHLQEKKGLYYVVLSYKDNQNKRKTKWISTKLPIKNNKKRAEQILTDYKIKYDTILNGNINTESNKADEKKVEDLLFTDFIKDWLELVKPNLEKTSYSSYQYIIHKRIIPYFEKYSITVSEIRAYHIQKFYQYAQSKYNLSNTTLIRYHANIRKSLQYALKLKLVTVNEADLVEKPKKQQVIYNYYNDREISELLERVKGLKIEYAVKMAVYYGLRRSEILGLKWEAIDFDKKIITIKHTVTEIKENGKVKEVEKNRTKNKGSYRVLPLLPEIEEYLLEIKKNQEKNKKIAKSSYHDEFAGYIYLDELGIRTKPNYITQHFNIFLKKNKMKMIRFHDLRHSCASILIANGISLKEIQLWLGHSDYSTTANIYVHLDSTSKNNTASVISNAISKANC
ncbi:integrase [Acetoanaerobium pronyense]|uniref:Integrase n=1 Tax=Acetoanaerobium pronyense TaxID=1482736 RepID=A0ABS4KK07_9FIRM|nr:tyrosine-type recombinase/integrase [Acetoanaerobium pronyense]MBP2028120.1 integrase [Acetoanaerobium pronyense]